MEFDILNIIGWNLDYVSPSEICIFVYYDNPTGLKGRLKPSPDPQYLIYSKEFIRILMEELSCLDANYIEMSIAAVICFYDLLGSNDDGEEKKEFVTWVWNRFSFNSVTYLHSGKGAKMQSSASEEDHTGKFEHEYESLRSQSGRDSL